MELKFKASIGNELLARQALIAFISPLNPTVEEIGEYKTIISEAVSNAIIHGYDGVDGIITIHAVLDGDVLSVSIKDEGRGIPDIDSAREPLFTTKGHEERSGMGFTIMESFSDELHIESDVGHGTIITFTKKFSPVQAIAM